MWRPICASRWRRRSVGDDFASARSDRSALSAAHCNGSRPAEGGIIVSKVIKEEKTSTQRLILYREFIRAPA
jgi:hypothetical protein